MSPSDFPRGFAEVDEYPPFPSVIPRLEGKEIIDLGISDYGEFLASIDHAWELLNNGMMVNGEPGHVRVVHRFSNAIQLKWTPNERRSAWVWPPHFSPNPNP